MAQEEDRGNCAVFNAHCLCSRRSGGLFYLCWLASQREGIIMEREHETGPAVISIAGLPEMSFDVPIWISYPFYIVGVAS